MDPSAPHHRSFDPVVHESHVIALFQNGSFAERARVAVLEAGLLPEMVVVMADGDALHSGRAHPVQDLFVPEDDYHDLHHALGRGHTVLVVRPVTSEARMAAVAALQGVGPLDLDEHGRNWRGTAAPLAERPINHATVSRADMHNRAVGGQDEVILDMTGQKMTVRRMSDADMTEAPFARHLSANERKAPLAPPPPPRDVPVQGTSYTYGVPAEIVRRMTAEEQVMAQPHTVEVIGDQTTKSTFLRVVDGQSRMGWREWHAAGPQVRSYVTERPGTASL